MKPRDSSDDAAASHSTRTSLLERAKAQEAAAWDRLVNLYGPLVYYWCRRARLDPDGVADVFQEVFKAVASHISQFDKSKGSFRGWLLTITQNKIRDHFRRELKSPKASGGSDAQDRLLQIPSPEDELDDVSSDDTDRELLSRALQVIRLDFEEQTWQAFWQTVVDGETAGSIAAALGTTVNAVYKAKARVLHRLREELEGLMD
jgi:RNA polymerase sigma-70 factor (ECF subfamily)